jgi:chorismate dehydratase
MKLLPNYPSKLAQELLDGEIDLGLIPVAVIPKLNESHIVTDFCIGSEGPVASVCLFSDVPIERIKRVLLDYHSRTSAKLVAILLKNFWKKEVEFIRTQDEFTSQINSTTAGLLIGDRCLKLRGEKAYCYDLGEAWTQFTGLPFVYAAWVSNKVLPESFLERFNAACKKGVESMEEVISSVQFDHYDVRTYLEKNISFELDAKKRLGLEKFLKYITASKG